MTTQTLTYSFDVAALLGLGTPDASPLPEARDGEIILRVPEGISLQSLRNSDVGKEIMHRQDWYDRYDWSKAPLPAGTYRIRLPIPNSNKKTFVEQRSLLCKGETVPPVTLVVLALLCCQKQGLPDPLKDGWARCQETTGDDRVVVSWLFERLYVVDYWDGNRYDSVWAAGALKAD